MTIRKQLQRDSENGKIAGVCAGLADYFGIETWLVRIATVAAMLLLAGPFVPVFYVAAWFILDKKSVQPKTVTSHQSASFTGTHSRGKGWHNDLPEEDKKVNYTYQDLIKFSNTEIYSAFGDVK